MQSVVIPVIKSQGIKTKLVQWINDIITLSGKDKNVNWIEPFFGTGVVGLNTEIKGTRIIGDTNPYIIKLYNDIYTGEVTQEKMREFLETEGKKLAMAGNDGYDYFREVRKRFNETHSSYDFVFLSRSGFNGMMRFNSKGEWNVPFCKNPERFSQAYITKICNLLSKTIYTVGKYNWKFYNQHFLKTIAEAKEGDFIYCDPPYFGRYTNYFNNWTEDDEKELFDALSNTKANFIMSTWHHDDFRKNEMIDKYWNKFNISLHNHFYYNGSTAERRHSVVEALIFNFDLKHESISYELF